MTLYDVKVLISLIFDVEKDNIASRMSHTLKTLESHIVISSIFGARKRTALIQDEDVPQPICKLVSSSEIATVRV